MTITALVRQNVAYLPSPNHVETILSDTEGCADLTMTAFVIPKFDDGSIGLVVHSRRGLDIAGGHIETGETMVEAAIRECAEETGIVVENLVPLGYLKMTLDEGHVIPEGYRYPHPISYQQIYIGQVVSVSEANDPDGVCAGYERISSGDDSRIATDSLRHFCRAALSAQ